MRSETLDKYFGATSDTKVVVNDKLDELIALGVITEEDINQKPDAIIRLAISETYNKLDAVADSTIKTVSGETYQSDGSRLVKLAKIVEYSTYTTATDSVISLSSLDSEIVKLKAELSTVSAGSTLDIDNLTNKLETLKYDNYANIMLDGTVSVVNGVISITNGVFKYSVDYIQQGKDITITDIPATTVDTTMYLALRSDNQVRWYNTFPLQDPPYIYRDTIWYDETTDTYVENTGADIQISNNPFSDGTLIDKFIFNTTISATSGIALGNINVIPSTNGQYGYSGLFDGLTSILDTTKVVSDTEVTVSMYVNNTDIAKESVLFMFSATGTLNSGACGIKTLNGSYYLVYPSNGTANSSRLFNINTIELGITHIVTTFDLVNNTAKVYIDGTLMDVALADSGVYDNTQTTLTVGGDNGLYFKGEISNVELYSKLLSTTEIQELNNQEVLYFQPIIPTMSFIKHPIVVNDGAVVSIDTTVDNYVYSGNFFKTANTFKLNGMTVDDIAKYIRNVRYMQDNAPDMVANEVLVGDMWFDTNDTVLSMAVVINGVLTWRAI